MTLFECIATIEGMKGYEDRPASDHLKAWAELIRTGKVWQLKGTYPHFATRLITEGVITEEGRITDD